MTQLHIDEGKLFYKLHPALMFFANERLKLLPDDVADPEEYTSLPPETRIKVRDALHAQPDLIDEFVRENPFDFTPEELEIVTSWKQAVVGKFYIFRYLILCRKLAEKLARKRPSPLLRGKPTTWACGIVRTIGSVNFLDDSSQSPHMKLTAIDKAFGVSQSTGQGKSKEIRKTFRIRQFDLDWWLPSRMDDNPMVWMLEVNGFVMDIRNCPRGMQEAAFKKGLIPYIPADRDEEE